MCCICGITYSNWDSWIFGVLIMTSEMKEYKFGLLLEIERMFELTNSSDKDSPLLFQLGSKIVDELGPYEFATRLAEEQKEGENNV